MNSLSFKEWKKKISTFQIILFISSFLTGIILILDVELFELYYFWQFLLGVAFLIFAFFSINRKIHDWIKRKLKFLDVSKKPKTPEQIAEEDRKYEQLLEELENDDSRYITKVEFYIVIGIITGLIIAFTFMI